MIHILIVDDHAIVRRGLMQIMKEEPDIEVSETANPHEALRLVRENNWDMLVLDLDLPGKRGLELLKESKVERPAVPVLTLRAYPEEQVAVRTPQADTR